MSSKQNQSGRSSAAGSERGSVTGSRKDGSLSARSNASGSQSGRSAGGYSASSGSTTARGRHNKIYRTPPTPPPGDRMEMEAGFTLDCNAVSTISSDYSKANPKLGPVIPPYNSHRDRHVHNYFSFQGIEKTLRKTGQDANWGTSIDGPVIDRFHNEGAGYLYLSKRNQFGAGHSRELIDGHSQFMQGIKPVIGYNGKFGFRRNTPWLRQMPSPFGTASASPTH